VFDIGQDINRAANFLKNGFLVAIPTETVYGLAAEATNPKAIKSVFEAKKRPTYDPLILHFRSVDQINTFDIKIPGDIEAITKTTWPGPLTILVPKPNWVDPIVNAGLDRIAVRIPNHPLTLDLLNQTDFPLVAPSANLFGQPSPTRPDHIDARLAPQCKYILDGGDCNLGLESTILGIENNQIIVYRKGGLTIEDLKEKTDLPIEIKTKSTSNPIAPGMLDKHYAPTKPLFVEDLYDYKPDVKDFVIGFGDSPGFKLAKYGFQLSKTESLKEAAFHYFQAIRLADKHEKSSRIIISFFPDEDLGRALNDKLKRAASNL
jgi:L-threonylcarbamoyladenylate synthase